MGKFQVIDHPLIQHKLTIIRDKNCGTKVFREVVDEIAMLMAYEVSRDMPLEDIVIETPITETTQKTLSGKKVAIIPILRAGIGMVDGILELIPAAKVGHIGLYRDEETLEPHEYFVKLPEDIDARQLFVVDPMLATGGSAITRQRVGWRFRHERRRLRGQCHVAHHGHELAGRLRQSKWLGALSGNAALLAQRYHLRTLPVHRCLLGCHGVRRRAFEHHRPSALQQCGRDLDRTDRL